MASRKPKEIKRTHEGEANFTTQSAQKPHRTTAMLTRHGKKSGAQRPITYHRTAATDAVAGRHAKDDKQTPIMWKRMSHAKPPLAKFTILSEVLLKRPSANTAAKTAQNKRIGRCKKIEKFSRGTRERAESGRLLCLNQVKVTSSNTTDRACHCLHTTRRYRHKTEFVQSVLHQP